MVLHQYPSYQKRARREDAALPDPKRRKLDDGRINENSQRSSTWSREQKLAPLSCSLTCCVPVKDNKRWADKMDVNGCNKTPPAICHESWMPSAILQDKPGNTFSCRFLREQQDKPGNTFSCSLLREQQDKPGNTFSCRLLREQQDKPGNTFSCRLLREQTPVNFSTEAGLPNAVATGQVNKRSPVNSPNKTMPSSAGFNELEIKSNAFQRESQKCIFNCIEEDHPDIQNVRLTQNITVEHYGVNIDKKFEKDKLRNAKNGVAAHNETANDATTFCCEGNRFCDTFNATCENMRDRSSVEYTCINTMPGTSSTALNTRKLSPGVKSSQGDCNLLGREFRAQKMLEPSQSFQLITDRQLRILYVSENVSLHLGYLQMDMLGHSIEDYIHPKDLPELMRVLTYNPLKSGDKNRLSMARANRMIYVAMTVCQPSSESRNTKPAYTLVQWNVKLSLRRRGQDVRVQRLIGLCRPVPTESVFAIRRVGSMLKNSQDMSFLVIFCNSRIINQAGLNDLFGQTVCDFHISKDVLIQKLVQQTFLSERTSNSDCLKLLSKKGVWIWIITQASIAYDRRLNPLYIVCKNSAESCEDTGHKLPKETISIYDKKYSCCCLETDPAVLELLKSIQAIISSYKKPKEIDIDMLLEKILCSDPMKYLVTPCSSLKMQGNLTTISKYNNNADYDSMKSLLNMAPHISQNNSLEASMKTTSDYNGTTKMKMPLHSNKTSLSILQYGETNFQQAYDAKKSMVSVFKDNYNAADVDPTQEHPSHFMLDTTTNSICFSPLSLFSDSLNPFALKDTFLALPQTHRDDLELCELYKPNDTKLPSQNDVGCKSADSAVVKDIEAVSEKLDNGAQSRKVVSEKLDNGAKSRNCLEAFDKFDSSDKVADTDILHHICLTQNLSRPHLTQGNSFDADYHNKTIINCHQTKHQTTEEHHTTEVPKYKVTGKLACLLQMESMPTSVKTDTVKTDFFKGYSKLTEHDNRLRNKDVTQPNIQNTGIHSNIQNIGIHSTNTCSSECKRQVCPLMDNLPDSLKSSLQVSSPVSLMSSSCCMLSPLTSHLVSSAATNSLYNNINHESERSSSHISVESKVATSDYGNSMTRIMTNRKSDPFLNQMSFIELNPLCDIAAVDDLDSSRYSVKPNLMLSQTLPLVPPEMANKHTNIGPQDMGQHHSSSSHAFLDSSSSMDDVSFISDSLAEFSTFLSNIPSNPHLITDLNNTANNPVTEHLGLGHDQPNLEQLQPSASGTPTDLRSNDFSDIEASARHSLLRTLLDKEGASIQGPLTCTEWILKQALKKKSNMKKAKMAFRKTNSRFSGSRRIKVCKNAVRKSVELPLPRSSHGCRMNFGKCRPQHKKPTKELPLPSSAVAVTAKQSMSPQPVIANNDSILQKDKLDNDGINSVNLSSPKTVNDDYNLPDDLLDMAVEYCSSLGTDQAEALILDLNDNFLFEDNMYSLIGSPTPESSTQNFTSSNGTQLQSSLMLTTELLSDNSKSKGNSENSHLSTTNTSPNIPAPLQQKLHLKPPQISIQTINKLDLPPLCYQDPTNKESTMSLLRAAVTTPNVDKLIEQIPLDNSKRCKKSEHEFELKFGNYPDIAVTKITSPQKHPTQSLTRMSQNKIFRVLSNTVEPSGKLLSSNPVCKPVSLIGALDHPDEAVCDQSDKANISKGLYGNGQQLQNLLTPIDSGSSTLSRSSSCPYILNISVHSGSPAKVLKVNRGSQNNINQNFKPFSSQATHREARLSATCCSSTQPVSVMIMRKENHRSKRSRNISVQTDNQPGEVYPEFELSPSDTFIYPSVMICSHPSPQSKLSPASTSQSSPENISDIENFLCDYSGNRSSSSAKCFQNKSSIPFLQRLLMGELSKDQYQRLDQQMLEEERKVSILSGNERINSSQSV